MQVLLASGGGEDFQMIPFYEGIFSNTENRSIPGINQVE
jgi:hypothetical protein